MYFFSADLHLGNDEILVREARPFASIEAFEEAFIQNVNQVASEEDTLYIVGDWFNYNSAYKLPPSDSISIIPRIRPRIVLIMGNGEERIARDLFGGFEGFRDYCLKAGFADVMPDCFLSFGDRQFYLNHYPSRYKNGYINLFGHTHRATGLWKPYGLNVGVDLNCYRPFSETDILDLVDTKENWWDIDKDCLCMGD